MNTSGLSQDTHLSQNDLDQEHLKKQYGSNEVDEIDITAQEIFTNDKPLQNLDCSIQKNSSIKAEKKSTSNVDGIGTTPKEENEYIKMQKAKKSEQYAKSDDTLLTPDQQQQ